MKVIHEKDYTYMGLCYGVHAFMTNAAKVSFDKELILVEKARYVRDNGKSELYDSTKDIDASLLRVMQL